MNGNNPRCVKGSKRSREQCKITAENRASNESEDYIDRMNRAAEQAWDSEIEW